MAASTKERRGSSGMTKSCGMRQYSANALHLLTHHAFVRQRVDKTAIAHLPTLDFRSNGGDFAGGVRTRNPRHWHRKAGHSASHEDIEIVQTYRLAADENVSRTDNGIGKFPIDDIFDTALLLDDCSFHLTPRLIAAEPAVGWLLKRFMVLVNNWPQGAPRRLMTSACSGRPARPTKIDRYRRREDHNEKRAHLARALRHAAAEADGGSGRRCRSARSERG